MPDAEALIRSVDMFSLFEADALSAITSQARFLNLRKNTVLMNEGETGECLYIIASGMIRIFISDADGGELTLSLEGAGSCIGEISVLDDEPRTASAISLEPSRVLVISKAAFRTCIEADPTLALHVIRALALRLRKATDDTRALAMKNVYQRLAAKLAELAVGDGDERQLARKYSQQDLATMIGASREMVSKILTELAKGGYVEMRERHLHLVRKLPADW